MRCRYGFHIWARTARLFWGPKTVTFWLAVILFQLYLMFIDIFISVLSLKKGTKNPMWHVFCPSYSSHNLPYIYILHNIYLILTLLAHLNYFIHHGFWSFFPGRRWAIPSFYTILKNPPRNHDLDAVGSRRSSPGKMPDLLRGLPGFRPGKLQRSGTGSPTR